MERLRLRRAPLAAAALWFALGIVLAHFVWQPVLVIVAALGLLAGLSILGLTSAARVSWMPVAAIWIVAGMAGAEWQPGPTNNTALARYADDLSRRVVGRVVRVQALPPQSKLADDTDKVAPWEAVEEAVPESERAESVDLEVEQIEQITPDLATMVPVTGGLRVTVYASPFPALACGDRVEMTTRLKLPERFRDPGVWQYADYLAEQGIGVRASVATKHMRRLGSGRPGWGCGVGVARNWAGGAAGWVCGVAAESDVAGVG